MMNPLFGVFLIVFRNFRSFKTIPLRVGVVVFILSLFLVSCSGGGSDFKNLGAAPELGQTGCSITSTTPSATLPLKVSSGIGALTALSVGLSSEDCTVKFALNGVVIPSTGTSLSLNTDLLPVTGSSVLTATTGSSVKTWTVTKNRPPICGAQVPATSGYAMGAGASVSLSGSATDPDGDGVTFSWKVNSTVVDSTILSAVSNATTTIGVFTPTAGNLGNNSVTMVVSDGVDSTNCNWAIDVNGSCSISSTFPSATAPVKISANSAASTLFQASATTGCAFSWKLNGSVVSAQIASSFPLDPASLSPGSNTLEVRVGNGSSADSKTWTVVRNIAPVCLSQTPTATGNSVGVGSNITLNGAGFDANGDSLTFNWTVNGAAVGSQFAISGVAPNSQAIFTPDSSNAGSNNVKATITDGLDSASCSWTVQTVPVCTMIGSSPSTSSLKVSANGGSSQTFVATTNDSSCLMSWSLNGTPISGATSPVLTLLSSQLNAGPATNTLVATAANGYTSATRTWTVAKNQAPVCNSQSPALSGNNVGSGGTIVFNATAGNADADSLTYAWSYNGGAASATYFALTSSGNTAEATFSPTNGLIGNNQTVAVAINDGYDNATCNWNVNVLNACVISTTAPVSPGPVKVPNTGTATTNFQATANAGCNYSWSLNGTPVSGATSNNFLLASSTLAGGSNTLSVSVTNGISTDTKAWTVNRNAPPTCASLVPATTGNVGVGGTINFQLSAGNTDSDNLTYAWLYNGTTPNPTYFTATAFGNSAQLAFTPNASFVGNNQAVSVAINDGYDITSCAYAVNVVNSCTISSTAPATGAAVRVANASASTKLFQASASSGCNYTWSLNGIAISAATSSNYTTLAADLTPGNNTLVVSVTNGSSSDSKTWTVVKNTPPVCSSQVPATAAQNIAVGGAITLTANGTDANSDALAISWKDNGSSAGSQFAITSGTGTSQALFSPDATNIGANAVEATISDSYDAVNCAWNVQVAPSCQISSATPSTSSAKVAFAGATSSSFIATPSDASCTMSWSLNGTPISGATTANVNVLSSSLSAMPSTNSLVATATNGSSTATRTWTVSKNQPPICSSQTPASSGNQVASGGTKTFQLTAGNPDSDVLNYVWNYNGSAINTSYFAVTSSGNNSQTVFTPNNGFIGNAQAVTATISDGYDNAMCSWAVDVLSPCQLTAPSPSSSSLKVANAGATATPFSISGTSGCAFTWSLNGTPIGGATTNSYSSLSSALTAGANTLSVSITNGVSTDSRTWTVTKNAVPTCSSQNPVATGNTVGVGGAITWQAGAGNSDADPLTYAWSYNGSPVNSSFFAVSSFGNASQAVFTPDSSYIGASQTVGVAINDGFDTASCSWNVNVQNSCTISTMVPSSGASVRIPYLATANSLFQAAANPGCNFSWQLNGTPVAGLTASSYNVASSNFSPGNNTLTVSVTNGSSTDTKTWNVVRNTPPACSSQTPAATGNTSAVGVTQTFVANGADGNSDPLTFTWKLNGTSAGSQLAVTPGTNTSSAVFTPDATSVGANNLVAQITDGYDTISCSWADQVLPACVIAGSTPSGTTPKVAFAAATNTTFSASANDSSCTTSWALNGSSLGITSAVANLASSQFSAAPATSSLVATVTNGYTTASRTWTVTKNTPPTCSSLTPAATGGTVGVGGYMTFQSVAGNTDSDPLTYSWIYNGSPVNPTYFALSSSGANAQAVFSPNASFVGSGQTVAVNINDGYDTAVCSWTVAVANACIISTASPTTASTVKMAASSAYSSTFTAAANPGCNFAWTLNGSTITGQTASTLVLTSALLASGNNSLQVTASNGSSTDSKTWNILKNTAPICSSQTPSSTGTVVAVGGGQNFVANALDANSDAMTYTWFNNGSAVGSEFAINSTAGNSTATLTASSGLVGSNSIRADINDGLDTASCNWTATVKAPCTISSATPSTATFKMPFNPTASQAFVAPASDSSCLLSWKLNGSTISGETSSLYTLASSLLTAGPATNTLLATATDGFTAGTRSWTISRNRVSSCSSQTPAATGNNVGVGGNLTFNSTAGNPDSDALTYSWIYNGAPVNATYFTVSSSGNTAQAIFNPSVSYVGTGQSLGLTISDGYDTANCAWTVNVVNSCSISSAFPSTSTYKVANLGSTSTSFGGIPSDSSCLPSWTLNGSAYSTANIVSVNSSAFTAAPATNTLTLTLNNGVSTPTSRTWTVSKNRTPVCSAQTPVTNPAAMIYTTTRAFQGSTFDADGDTLSGYAWLFNGAVNNSVFTGVSTASGISNATFAPTFSQIGTAQSVALQFTDGYDTAMCNWGFDITNPNVVAISSCNPAGNPIVVYSTGLNATRTLQVVASNATAGGYSWLKNGLTVGGATSSSYAVSSSGLSAGDYTFRGVASDAQGNTAFCDYNVKVNAAPTISAISPSNSQTYKMNYGSTINFSVTASDANLDALTYTWTMDGTTNVAIGTNAANVVLNPNYNPSLVGSHTIAVTITDGFESITRSWTVEINLFNQACNTLFNSNTSGGQICTLVGVPGMGHGLIPSADQSQIRTQPAFIIDDGSGNYIFSDQLNHTVNFFNRSGSTITRWGMTMLAGTVNVVMGNGASGITIDGLYNRQFKLDTPNGVAYDVVTKNLWVSDYNNHRVAMMDNTGIVATVISSAAGGGVTNNLAGNTDGSAGTSATCNNPTGLDLVNYGGTRYLYVACYSTHTIKRLDVLPGSPTQNKIYTVVGRLNTSNQSFAGNTDGTLGTTGLATANGPWAIADDGFGNIFWVEWSGLRLRTANLTGSTINYFQGATPVAGNALNITATDTASTLTAASAVTWPTTPTITPTKFSISGPSAMVTGTCTQYRLQSQTAGSQWATVGANTVGTMTGNGAGQFYTDAGCTVSAAGSLTILNGTAETIFYFKAAAPASFTLSVTGTLSTSSLAVQVSATSTATKLAVFVAPNFPFANCLPFTIQLQNATGAVSTFATNRVISLSNTTTFGNFYSNSGCTTFANTLTITAGATEVTGYFTSTTVAQANQVTSLLGNTGSNGGNVTTNTSVNAGLVTLRQTRGLAVATSGGAVSGFFISGYDQHRIVYANNTGSSVTIGGTVIGGRQVGQVAGTGTAGFNSDGLGDTARVNTVYGVGLSNDQTKLMYGDFSNARVRYLDLSTNNGNVETELGNGRLRAGSLGDSPIAANAMYLSGPTNMVIDDTNRKLYISDSLNSRIRRVDMLTGWVDTMVGKGSGAASVEQEDPTNAFMNAPRGLAMMTASGTNFLVYADQQASTAINQDCQIRALNLTPNIGSPPAVNLLGTAIPGFKVSTVVGDYLLGCNSVGAQPANTNLGSGTNVKLYNTEGISSDGTNLYHASYNDHCILKTTPSGGTSVVVGTCGTAGTTDGSTSLATIRFPTAIVVDPNYAADGNFFFADAPDLNPTRIRYVNFRNTSVTVGNFTIPAASPPYAQVTTLWTISMTTGGRVYGLAAFGPQLCIAGGLPGSGSSGTHNVTCYDRSTSLSPITLRVGPNEASSPAFRAGAPVSNIEQEGIAATSAFMSAPYGITFDAAGNLYIPERNNHIIRMVRRWW